MEKFSGKLREILQCELHSLNASGIGVDHIGYRYFLKDGRSFGLPTCEGWYKNYRDETFNKVMKNFLSNELVKLHSQNHHLVVRSADSSEYLTALKWMGMDNSLGLYIFNKDRIDSFLYILNQDISTKRNLMINNLHFMASRAKRISQRLGTLTEQLLLNDNYEFVLYSSTQIQVFSTKNIIQYATRASLSIDGQEISLTIKETEVLKALDLHLSNISLAEMLNLSLSTLEKHLQKLKFKLHLSSKEDLIKFSHSSNFVNRF